MIGKLPSLIKQIVWTIIGEESLFGSMNLSLSSLMDLMSVMQHFYEMFSYSAFFDSIHFQRFDPLYKPILAKKIYDICQFQIFKKISIFRNILNTRRLRLDCIHFQRTTSQGGC